LKINSKLTSKVLRKREIGSIRLQIVGIFLFGINWLHLLLGLLFLFAWFSLSFGFLIKGILRSKKNEIKKKEYNDGPKRFLHFVDEELKRLLLL
jgi:hypothetical protein